ncbi:MAG: class I SAM-dependent methyltransferase [Dehalococcoidia bacterium]
MRILQGTKPVEAAASWRDAFRQHRVVIDVGAGDGRWAYDGARHDAESLYVAVDPDAESLAEYAYRAGRKPSRGGTSNALFVIASVEELPQELTGIAALVRVNFPWGSLLRGLVLPEAHVLEALASLGVADARFEFVISYDPEHDIAGLAGETLPPLTEARIDDVLAPPYAAAGLQMDHRRQMSLDEAIALPSTWARRLLHGRRREVFWIEGSIVS